MGHFLNEVNQYEKLITLLFSFIVTVSTAVYAFLTQRLTNETIKLRKAQTDPKITVYLKHNEIAINYLNFVIENIGTGQAYDIHFTIIKEIELNNTSGNMLKNLGSLKNGIKHMAPKQKIETWYMSLLGIYDDVINQFIEIDIQYKNDSKELISEKFTINLSQFGNITQLGNNPMHVISGNIEKMEKNIEKIASGWNNLKVDIYNSEDRIKIQKERKNNIQQLRSKNTNS